MIDKPVRDVLTAFSSPDPTPGGGSASALASSVGASLLVMVARLPKTRTGADGERQALTAAAGVLASVRDRLRDAIDADSAAYDAVVAAYKLPKASTEDQESRKVAIARALRGAIDVPLDVVRLSARALTYAEAVAASGQRSAASDVGVAMALLRAGLHGAQLNIETNLSGLKDEAYTNALREELAILTRSSAQAAQIAERALA